MESALVNARVPLAKKEACTNMLKALGSTPSQLINCAYDYVLEYGKLPRAEPERPRDYQSLASFIERGTLSIDWEQPSRRSDCADCAEQ